MHRREHWAYQPVARPAPPQVQNTAWVRTELDGFVLAKLQAKGLTPSPEADRRTLIRRLTFDLIGLPPTIEEVEAFAADPSPDAYERVVDRLLASPHYGERWGRHWLDVARYADTKGYAFERDRRYPYAYTYRDYVIGRSTRPALRPLYPGATGGRSARPRRRSAIAGRARLHHASAESTSTSTTRRRPDRRGHARPARADGRLCPLPRPQVRRDSHGRLLLAVRRVSPTATSLSRRICRSSASPRRSPATRNSSRS